jgi:hypothetical protein
MDTQTSWQVTTALPTTRLRQLEFLAYPRTSQVQVALLAAFLRPPFQADRQTDSAMWTIWAKLAWSMSAANPTQIVMLWRVA